MYSLKTLPLSLLLISLVIAPAYAKRHGLGDPLDHEGKGPEQTERLKQALDLTPQQEASLKEIHTNSKEKTTTIRGKAEANREAIREVFDAEALDEPRLRELTSEQAELRSDLMIEKHAMRAQVNQILTPQQQKKHEEFRQQRMGNKEHRRCNE